MADKKQLGELAALLEECREFLAECDDDLAGEVGMKAGISGRIWRAAGEIGSAAALARRLEKDAD